jgi:hypothetical protein
MGVNAKRQAINPNDVEDPVIEYLTPKASVRRSPIAILLMSFIGYQCALVKARRANHLIAQGRLATCAAVCRRYRRLSVSAFPTRKLWSAGSKEAVRWLFSTFERHVLRRVDAVNAQYLPQSNLPAILFPLRDDFHLLPWADKKRLKRLAYKLANLMKSEFMREFDFQYEKTADVEFSTIYAYGAIASKATALNIAIRAGKYCDEVLTAEDALRVLPDFKKKMVAG